MVKPLYRKFNGKRYTLKRAATHKNTALKSAKWYKQRGYAVRIHKFATMGGKGLSLYGIYTSKKK